MKRVLSVSLRLLLLMMLALAGASVLTGCASPDPENQAYRPWGGAQGYQGGLPSSLTEGR